VKQQVIPSRARKGSFHIEDILKTNSDVDIIDHEDSSQNKGKLLFKKII
jgi:hypothetical protein